MKLSGQERSLIPERLMCFTVVDIRIGSVQIAERFCQTMRNSFENKPPMRGAAKCRPCYDEPQLEGHIESRRPWLLAIELDSREIVKRILAAAYQLHDSVEPAVAGWNFKRRARNKTETAQAGNEGEVKRFVAFVVRDVQKRGGLCRCPFPSFGIRLAESLRWRR